jgi:hypothetical protein
MMGFFAELLGRSRIDSRELRATLLRIERERRRIQLELRKLEARQQRVLEKLKDARRARNTVEVDYLYEDLKTTHSERDLALREAKILNLEGITVKRYLHGLQRLERRNDERSVTSLLARLRSSGLAARLEAEQLRETEYLDELRAVFDAAGVELEPNELAEEDPEKAALLAALDAINDAEDQGDLTQASAREEELRARLEQSGELP